MEIRQSISMWLEAKAYRDPEFRPKFENPNKNLDECVLYVTYRFYKKAEEEAMKEKKNTCKVVVPSDDEIFAYAEQYYTDEDLRVEGTTYLDAKIVSFAATSFTEEEKRQQRIDAIKKYQDDVIAECKKKDEERKKKAQQAKKPVAPTLIPDASEESEQTQENKEQAVQMELF